MKMNFLVLGLLIVVKIKEVYLVCKREKYLDQKAKKYEHKITL